jgi:hypothetical protein
MDKKTSHLKMSIKAIVLLTFCSTLLFVLYNLNKSKASTVPLETVKPDNQDFEDGVSRGAPQAKDPAITSDSSSGDVDQKFIDSAQEAFLQLEKGVVEDGFALLDPLFGGFLDRPDLTRAQKIQTLWELFLKTPEGLLAQYVLDHLTPLRPFELTSNLIAIYPNTSEQMTRYRIRDLIYENMHRYEEDPELLAQEAERYQKASDEARKFILGLQGSSDPDEAGFALKQGVLIVDDNEQSAIIKEAVANMLDGGSENSRLAFDELADTWIEAIAGTFTNNDLINLLEETLTKYPDLGSSDGLINALLTRAEYHREIPKDREILSKIFKRTSSNPINSMQYTNWVKAKLLLEGGSNYDEASSIRAFAATATPVEIAAVVASEPAWLLQHLTSEEILKYATKIEVALADGKYSDTSHILHTGLSYIAPSLDDENGQRIGQLLTKMSEGER